MIEPGGQGPRVVVIKVGGSLLGWEGLASRLAGFLSGRAAERVLLIVGGGPAADWARDLDRLHGLGEERSHHLAIRAMDLSAHALAAFGDAAGLAFTMIGRIEDLDAAWMSGRLPILAPGASSTRTTAGPPLCPTTGG